MTAVNPFPTPSPLQRLHITQMVAIARLTYGRGWNPGTAGNFSVRGSGDLLWQSPSGVPKGAMRVGSFLPVSISTVKAVNPLDVRPSAETPLHAGIYRVCPMARAVVHVHSPALVKASAHARQLVFSGKEMSKALGSKTHEEDIVLTIIPNTQDMGRLGQDMVKFMSPELPVLVLKEHGVYAWGRDPQEALNFIEGIEFLCQTTDIGA